jgi:hypothetical protein
MKCLEADCEVSNPSEIDLIQDEESPLRLVYQVASDKVVSGIPSKVQHHKLVRNGEYDFTFWKKSGFRLEQSIFLNHGRNSVDDSSIY